MPVIIALVFPKCGQDGHNEQTVKIPHPIPTSNPKENTTKYGFSLIAPTLKPTAHIAKASSISLLIPIFL